MLSSLLTISPMILMMAGYQVSPLLSTTLIQCQPECLACLQVDPTHMPATQLNTEHPKDRGTKPAQPNDPAQGIRGCSLNLCHGLSITVTLCVIRTALIPKWASLNHSKFNDGLQYFATCNVFSASDDK